MAKIKFIYTNFTKYLRQFQNPLENDSVINAFILSSPRSGSTLLRLSLGKLENVVALPETHFYNYFEGKSIEFGNKPEVKKAAVKWVDYYTIKRWPIDHNALVERIAENAESLRDIIEFTAAAYVREVSKKDPQKTFVIEKSPPHIFYIEQIRKMFPDSKMIFLVRDPRDVVASLKGCDWSTSNVLVNARVWRNGVERFGRHGHIVRYEKLVHDASQEMSALCAYLQIEFDVAVLDQKTSDQIEEKTKSSSNSLKPITTAFVGSYTSRLSKPERELEIVQWVCRNQMLSLGYELVDGKYDLKYQVARIKNIWNYLLKRN